jgi:hypothetical protein
LQGDGTSALGPVSFAPGHLADLPAGRRAGVGSIEGSRHRALGHRVTFILGYQGLLPEACLGVLFLHVEPVFNARGTALEVSQVVGPVLVAGGIVTAAIEHSLRAAPEGVRRAAATSPTAVLRALTTSDAALSINLDLVLVPVNGTIVAIIPAPDGREFQAGIGAGRVIASPVELRIRGGNTVTCDDGVVFFRVPGVVAVRDGNVVHAGFSRIGVKDHQRLALAGVGVGRCVNGVSGLAAASPTSGDPRGVYAVTDVVIDVLEDGPSHRSPVQDSRGGGIRTETNS